jgi:diguanylate cyclase (GGDEF)-like protein/PAS domain S-box-containing protein
MMNDELRSSDEASAGLDQVDPEVFRHAMYLAPTPMLLVRGDGTIATVNQVAEDVFGYSPDEMVGQPVELLVPPGMGEDHVEFRAAFGGNPEPRPMGARRDLYAVSKEGAKIPVEIGLSPIETDEGLMVLCIVIDLSQRKRMEEQLTDLAELLEERNEELQRMVATDPLTSLRTRRTFIRSLETLVQAAVRYARPLSVLILDVDHFKAYNDQYGHLAGDEVLRQVGAILQSVARRSDIVARIGGEEIGIILPETDEEGAVALGERFRQAIEAAEWPKRPITVSLGAATVAFRQAVPRPETPDLSAILQAADRALYWSKSEGRNRVTHASQLDAVS